MCQLAFFEDPRSPAERLASAWRSPDEELTWPELVERCGVGVAIALPLAEAMRRGEILGLRNPTRYWRRA